MLVIELEAVRAEERPRLQREGFEIDRSAAHPIETLEHRRDFGRSHFGAEFRHLLVGGLALADQKMAAVEAADEADPVEERPVERPVLNRADIFEENRAMAIPRAWGPYDHSSIADADIARADQRVIAEAVSLSAESRAS